MKTLKLKLTGLRPLVMHNGQLADRKNEWTQAMKAITSKKKKTDADHDELERLEWMGGLYWSDTMNAIAIPSDVLERVLLDGAKKTRNGVAMQAGVFVVEEEVELAHRMRGKSREDMIANPAYSLRKGVCNPSTGARVMRVRPMVPPGWSLAFEVEFDENVISQADIVKAATDAGALVGLGDWRPKFGRFSVEVLL